MIRFAHEISGATAIEYALVASLISIVIVTAAELIGGSLLGTFQLLNAAF